MFGVVPLWVLAFQLDIVSNDITLNEVIQC